VTSLSRRTSSAPVPRRRRKRCTLTRAHVTQRGACTRSRPPPLRISPPLEPLDQRRHHGTPLDRATYARTPRGLLELGGRFRFRLISALSRRPESPLVGTSRRLRLPSQGGGPLHVWRSASKSIVAPPRAGSLGRDVSPPLSVVVGPIDAVPSPVSVRKPPRFRGISWKASLIAYSSETGILQGFLRTLGIPRSACHAEGRGFESLQPLHKRPGFAGLFSLQQSPSAELDRANRGCWSRSSRAGDAPRRGPTCRALTDGAMSRAVRGGLSH
jgi:hypothetical protein